MQKKSVASHCRGIKWKTNKFMRAGCSLFSIYQIAAATRNKPESLRELRAFRNYIKPNVTMTIFDTEQN